MRFGPILLAMLLSVGGCWEMPPGNVPLTTAGEEVEILTETPSPEVYEPFQDVSAQSIGPSGREATVSARHMLRNRGAELHARFVSVDDSTAELAWDFSGRTIVTLKGRVFRVKEDEAPPATRAFLATPSMDMGDASMPQSPMGPTDDALDGGPASSSPASSSDAGDARAPAGKAPVAKPGPKVPAAPKPAAPPSPAPAAKPAPTAAPQSPMAP